jgi:hypothetical protein
VGAAAGSRDDDLDGPARLRAHPEVGAGGSPPECGAVATGADRREVPALDGEQGWVNRRVDTAIQAEKVTGRGPPTSSRLRETERPELRAREDGVAGGARGSDGFVEKPSYIDG